MKSTAESSTGSFSDGQWQYVEQQMIAESVRYRDEVPLWARWCGFSQVALTTSDLDETIQFYQQIVGMRASQIFPAAAHGRHCVLSPDGNTLGIHFFERDDYSRYGLTHDLWPTAQPTQDEAQCLSFLLHNEAAANALKKRLAAHYISTEETPVGGLMHSIAFLDNNDLLLKASWPKAILG